MPTRPIQPAHDPRLAKVWLCGQTDCPGYRYDPLRGEHTQDIAPNTAFEDVPDDFYCPACGAPKTAFKLIEDRATRSG